MIDQQLITFLVGLIGFSVGAVVGGGTALVILLRITSKLKTDLPSLDYLEKLYNSIPVAEVRTLLRDVMIIGGQVTDGKPNELSSPQPAIPGEPGFNA